MDALVVKSVVKINTAFFPWSSSSVLVPGCCLSYEVLKPETPEKEGYEEDVVDEDLCIDIECTDKPSNPSSLSSLSSEFKVLKPYAAAFPSPMAPPSPPPPPPMRHPEDYEHYTRRCHGDIIPSPSGERCKGILSYPSYTIEHYPMTLQYPVIKREMPDTRKHKCEYCLKEFKRSSSLSNHRMIHKNDKTFKCSQCDMCFLRKSDLGKHMVIHSGSKPYQCNVCGKRFSQSSNMLTHQRRHTGIRPYSCHVCGKSFYRKVDVRRHASVHRSA